MMELVVHLDDLAVDAWACRRPRPVVATDAVIGILATLAAQAGTAPCLSSVRSPGRNRAPATIAAF